MDQQTVKNLEVPNYRLSQFLLELSDYPQVVLDNSQITVEQGKMTLPLLFPQGDKEVEALISRYANL